MFQQCKYVIVDPILMSLDVAYRRGEVFDRTRHASGTEIKAITYSAMQITEKTEEGGAEIFVIVDI